MENIFYGVLIIIGILGVCVWWNYFEGEDDDREHKVRYRNYMIWIVIAAIITTIIYCFAKYQFNM